MFIDNGHFWKKSGNINSNTASSEGGGVYMRNGNFWIDAGEINSNSGGTSGGGICMWSSGGNKTLTIKGGEINSNSSSNTGGGIAHLAPLETGRGFIRPLRVVGFDEEHLIRHILIQDYSSRPKLEELP